jgi:hypothetical protein
MKGKNAWLQCHYKLLEIQEASPWFPIHQLFSSSALDCCTVNSLSCRLFCHILAHIGKACPAPALVKYLWGWSKEPNGKTSNEISNCALSSTGGTRAQASSCALPLHSNHAHTSYLLQSYSCCWYINLFLITPSNASPPFSTNRILANMCVHVCGSKPLTQKHTHMQGFCQYLCLVT